MLKKLFGKKSDMKKKSVKKAMPVEHNIHALAIYLQHLLLIEG